MQAFQVAAFAFPVSDGVADELESGNAAKIRDGKDGVEYGLKAGVFAFLRKHVHLEEPLVGFLLDLDEIRDLDRVRIFEKFVLSREVVLVSAIFVDYS
jgi:hypothetical protein